MFAPGLSRSVGTSHVLLRSGQVPLSLSSSVKVSTTKRGRWVVFEPLYAHGIKMRSTKLVLLNSAPLIRKHHQMQ